MANNAFVVGGSSNAWNYSDPSKDGFAPTIQGTVVKLVRRQGMDFNTKQPAVWPDGNPRLVYGITIADEGSGENKEWVVDAKKSSVAIRAIGAALGCADGDPVDVSRLYGMNVSVSTSGLQNMKINGRSCTARMWQVVVLGQGNNANLLGIEDQVNANPQPKPVQQQPTQAQPMQQQGYQQQQPMQQQGYQQAQPMQQQRQVFAQNQTDLYDEDIPF